MRNLLLLFIFLVTFSCVVFLLWKQRTRHLAYVSAKVDGYWDGGQEKRKFKRFKMELAVDCTIPEKPGDTYKTFSKDISGQGICLKIPEIIPQGGVLDLVVSMPDERPIKITGEVVWVKEVEAQAQEGTGRTFDAGIRFLRIARQDQKLLDKFLTETDK
jgi:c-di-GMP-binding flagellar brake protein YcgR